MFSFPSSSAHVFAVFSPPREQNDISLPAIVGGVMGVVVTVLVVLVGCVLVCIPWRKRRRSSKRHRGELSRQPTEQNGVLVNNPVYEGNSNNRSIYRYTVHECMRLHES